MSFFSFAVSAIGTADFCHFVSYFCYFVSALGREWAGVWGESVFRSVCVCWVCVCY